MAAGGRTVTGLRERRGGRVAVELDGAPWRVLPGGAVVEAGLAVGRELDRDRARTLARAVRRDAAVARALRSLAAHDRSRDELDERLARAGVPPPVRADALAALERAGLVDDARVARLRAEELARRGYGDAAIRADLDRRGIDPGAAGDAVAGLEPEPQRARRALGSGRPEPRLLRRLAARGFDADTLRELAFADPA